MTDKTMEWQPIETAPNQGYFLAYDLKHMWRDRPFIAVVKRAGDTFLDRHDSRYNNLTHWMPLPNPPSESKENKEIK